MSYSSLIANPTTALEAGTGSSPPLALRRDFDESKGAKDGRRATLARVEYNAVNGTNERVMSESNEGEEILLKAACDEFVCHGDDTNCPRKL